jgi:hypothetical protein
MVFYKGPNPTTRDPPSHSTHIPEATSKYLINSSFSIAAWGFLFLFISNSILQLYGGYCVIKVHLQCILVKFAPSIFFLSPPFSLS